MNNDMVTCKFCGATYHFSEDHSCILKFRALREIKRLESWSPRTKDQVENEIAERFGNLTEKEMDRLLDELLEVVAT